MELYTLERFVDISDSENTIISFKRKDPIDIYESFIWTERYFGNGDVQITCPPTTELKSKLAEGTYLGLSESDEMMIVETTNEKDGKLVVYGISIPLWLNNRFIRNSKSHKIKSWVIEDKLPGYILWQLLSYAIEYGGIVGMEESNTDIFSDYIDMLRIPEIGLRSYDTSGIPVTASVDFGPLYDAMYQIATQYNIGMQIQLEEHQDLGLETPPLKFRSYTGIDRTRTQSDLGPRNAIVQFSKDFDSLTDIEEIHSLSKYKSLCFAFGSSLDSDLGLERGDHNSGIAWVEGSGVDNPDAWGLGCRATQIFVDSLTGHPIVFGSTDTQRLMNRLNKAAIASLKKLAPIHVVGGQVISTSMYKYGRDYFLGDKIELKGANGIVSNAQVMEYIRSKDAAGEKEYPTLSLVDSMNVVETRSDLGPPPDNDYDKVGDAYELEGNSGSFDWSNFDCTTDGVGDDDGNSDWLVNKAYNDVDERNWRTTWFKLRVTESDWLDTPHLVIKLTDYDNHMVLFACSPHVDAIPAAGNAPSWANRAAYRSLGWDVTSAKRVPPFDDLIVRVHKNWWLDPDVLERWIYIGVGSPPVGLYHQRQDRGGNFTLQWKFKP